MAGAKKGQALIEDEKRLPINEWDYPEELYLAKKMVMNMDRMGAPVVVRDGIPSVIRADEQGVRIQPLDQDELFTEMKRFSLVKEKTRVKARNDDGSVMYGPDGKTVWVEAGETVSKISNATLRHARAWIPELCVPLTGFFTHPIVSPRGRIILRNGITWTEREYEGEKIRTARANTRQGYDAETKYFFSVEPEVQKRLAGMDEFSPKAADVERALEIIDDFLCDWIFSSMSAKASAVAFMLLLVCQKMITGHIPMTEVRAGESHSGKSKLIFKIINGITGQPAAPLTPPFRDDPREASKVLFHELYKGTSALFLDDLEGRIKSSDLNSMLTAENERFEGRLLGTPYMVGVYCRVPIVVSGNNLQLAEDLRNRTMLIDIDKRPEDYRYKHADATAHARRAHCDLLWALFTVYRNWKVNCNGELYTGRRMTGCIDFSEKIGGMLAGCGIEDFLLDTGKQISKVDGYVEQAMEMAELWHERLGNVWVYAKDLAEAAVRAGYIKRQDCEIETQKNANGEAALRADGSVVEIFHVGQEVSNRISPKLERVRGRKLPNGYRIDQDTVKGRTMWRVVKL